MVRIKSVIRQSIKSKGDYRSLPHRLLCPDALQANREAWQEAYYHRAPYPILHFRPRVTGRSRCNAQRQKREFHRVASPLELLLRPHLLSPRQS